MGRNVSQFARLLGVTPPCISQWEREKHPIPHLAINLINALKFIEQIQSPKLPLPIQPGKCACGCQGDVPPSPRTRTSRGLKKGDYPAFLKGHNYRACLKKEAAP
jgi:hypothetical protein